MEWELLGIVLVGMYALVAYYFNFPAKLPYTFSQSSRDDRLDQMRGLAMIGIVCIHIHSYFEYFHPNVPNITHWTLFLSNLSRYSVPVFIFGSSLFLKKKDGYWLGKIKSLLIPYTLASVAGYLIKYSNYTIGDFLVRYLTGQVFAPFYFVPLLFQFYFLFYILPENFKKGAGLIIFLIISIIINLTSNLHLFNNLLPNWYEPISIFNFLFFFVLGLYIKEKLATDYKPSKLQLVTLMFLFVCAVSIIFSLSQDNQNLKNHHLVYPLLSILILNQILPAKTDQIFFKILNFIGKNSLYIFLLHPFVIHQMHAIDPFWIINPPIGYLVTLLLNISIPSAIAYLFTYQSRIASNRSPN